MADLANSRVGFWQRLTFVCFETRANQLAEFAVTLPLFVVVAVAIFDFGAAFTVKQKLVNIAQAGARVGASQPSNDLTVTSTNCNQLVSVCAVRDVVSRSLLDNNLKDCGLSTRTAGSAGMLAWRFTANTGCPTALVLTVERGHVYSTTLAAPFDTSPLQIESTRVTLSYPYQWQLNKVLGLVNGSFSGPATLTTVATMQNLN